MRTIVNFIIMLAMPFVFSEENTPAEIPPSQRVQELRPDTSQQVRKADFAMLAQDNVDQQLITKNNDLATSNRINE